MGTVLLRDGHPESVRGFSSSADGHCQATAGRAFIRLREHGEHTLKTLHSHREVPISGELMQKLVELEEQADGTLFGVPEVDRVYHYWRHRLQLTIASAGVEGFTLGAFRKTRSTRLLNAGVPIHIYQRMMGHSAKTALEHYAAVSTGDIWDAFEQASDDDAEDADLPD